MLDRNGGIAHRDRFEKSRDVGLARRRIEQTDMGKRAQLIVRSPGLRVGEISIHLVGLYAQDDNLPAIVALQALAAAGITPSLDARGRPSWW